MGDVIDYPLTILTYPPTGVNSDPIPLLLLTRFFSVLCLNVAKILHYYNVMQNAGKLLFDSSWL